MPRFAMMFPGQGSQALGMLGALGRNNPDVNKTFAEAAEVLGYDVAKLVAEGPAEELDRTERTQPVLVAAGVAVWRVWRTRGGATPDSLAGHSLGEYTALVAAGALDFGDALRLTALRGQAMQSAVPAGQGAMAAIIGLGDEAVQSVCREASKDEEIVEAANFNAPGQVVIAGHKTGIERAVKLAKDKGAKLVKQLAVSVPSHSRLMRPAAERLQSHLSEIPIRHPQIPVLHNIDGRSRDDVDAIRKALVAQLDNPVQWVRSIRSLREDGISLMLECGPGKVLTGLARRIDKEIRTIPLNEPEGLREALAVMEAG